MAEVMDRLMADIKQSMKAQEKDKLSVLRMMLAEIKNARVQGKEQQDLTAEAEEEVLGRYQKKLQKSLADYKDQASRDKLEAEIAIVGAYLPEKATPEQVASVIDGVLAETDERNFGLVMKLVMAKLGKSGDGKIVSGLLKDKLNS